MAELQTDFTERREDSIDLMDQWIRGLTESGAVGIISPEVVCNSLSECGGNFEQAETLDSLGEYTNKARADAMRMVWGSRYDEYKSWADQWANDYEANEGNRELPKLEKSGSKISGMLHFFGELTAYASGKLDFDSLKLYLETRSRNGKLWQDGKKEERAKVTIPSGKEIRISSFPPSFPEYAWEKIKSWR